MYVLPIVACSQLFVVWNSSGSFQIAGLILFPMVNIPLLYPLKVFILDSGGAALLPTLTLSTRFPSAENQGRTFQGSCPKTITYCLQLITFFLYRVCSISFITPRAIPCSCLQVNYRIFSLKADCSRVYLAPSTSTHAISDIYCLQYMMLYSVVESYGHTEGEYEHPGGKIPLFLLPPYITYIAYRCCFRGSPYYNTRHKQSIGQDSALIEKECEQHPSASTMLRRHQTIPRYIYRTSCVTPKYPKYFRVGHMTLEWPIQ